MILKSVRNSLFTFVIVLVIWSMAGCGPVTPVPTSTPASTPTKIPTRTPSPIATNAPLPSSTPTLVLPAITPVFDGMPIPSSGQVFNSKNIYQMVNVAQWGKGNILGVAFSPNGNSFIVGSASGFAIYNIQDFGNQPQWISFEQPFYFDSMFFSEDGSKILLENSKEEVTIRQIRNFPDGWIVSSNTSEIDWLKTSTLTESWGSNTVNSLDGSLEFKSRMIFSEESPNQELSIREIYDHVTGNLLYELPDETIQITYSEWHKPEGCDLNSFSYCGNVYDPSASHPYRVAFSPSNKSLAILYRAPNLWNSNQYSTLKVYDAKNGQVLATIGYPDNPVETFAYSPDGKTIGIGYVDGSIQLWNVSMNTVTHSAQHFNSPIIDLEYSYDGRFVIIQRSGSVEVRSSEDGSIVGKYNAVTFAVSPTENILALGNKKGIIRVLDFKKGETVFYIQAHGAEIYALVFSPDGKRITSSGDDCAVRNWNAKTGQFIHDFAENTTNAYMEEGTKSRILIYYMAYIPGTSHLLGYGSWSRVVSWNINSGATQYLIEPEPLEYYQGMITLNPHFPEFFGVNVDKQEFYIDYTTYQIKTGEKIGEFVPPENLPDGCAPTGPVSEGGKLMFTKGYENRAGQICVLDTENHVLLQTNNVLSKESVNYYVDIDWLYMSPNNSQIIVSLYGGVLHVYQIVQ